MDGLMIHWDEILSLRNGQEREVCFIRDAERLGHRPEAIESPLAIMHKEPEPE